jgi:diguanylate cyclase (GGDEF)-like protein
MAAPWSEQAQTYREYLDLYMRTGDKTFVSDACRRMFRIWQHDTPVSSFVAELHHDSLRLLTSGGSGSEELPWSAVDRAASFLTGVMAALDSLRDNTSELVQRDRLTGLPNHRGLVPELTAEIARSLRHRRPLSIAVAAVAGLDRLQGSPADAAVYRVAWSLGRVIRREDQLFRSGRDELVVILPETPEPGAKVAGERYRSSIEAGLRGDEFFDPMKTLVGIGISTMPADGVTAASLLDAGRTRAHESLGSRERAPEAVVVEEAPARTAKPSP